MINILQNIYPREDVNSNNFVLIPQPYIRKLIH